MKARVPAWQPVAESVAVVVLIASALIALFSSLPGSPVLERAVLYRAGGLAMDEAFTEPWRVLSGLWLHADLDHLISNLVVLLMMSVLLTRALGWDRFVLLYVGSGVAGAVFSLVAEQPALAVGASGAIFGLTGATVAYALNPRRVLHEDEVFAVREALLPIAGFQLVMSFTPGISWGAHLGGFGFGALCAATGLADLGLPERAAGVRLEPVRWGRVLAMTFGVIAFGFCSSVLTLGLLVVYVSGLVLSGRTGPDWRPELRPVVMLAALGTLGVNAGAVGLALHRGDPWGLDATPTEVVLPGGLGEVSMPAQLVAERFDGERSGYPLVRYGDPDRFPFALQLVLAERANPAEVVRHLLELPVDGEARSFTFSSWEAECPWLGWQTESHVGIVVFTGTSVVNLELLRAFDPVSAEWREAEDALVESLQDLPGCEPAEWPPGELGLALYEAGMDHQAVVALGRALEDQPEAHDLRALRAELFLEQEHCQGALLEFWKLTEDDPKRPSGWTGVARATLECSRSSDSLEAARKAASQALELIPGDPIALEARADALLGLGLREEAAADLQRAADNTSEPEERARLVDRARQAERGFRVRDRMQ